MWSGRPLGFCLHLSKDWWCQAPFHAPAGHGFVFGKILLRALCPLRHTLHIVSFELCESPCAYNLKDLLAVWCANISLSSVESHFISLFDFYVLHKLFGLMYSSFCLNFGCDFQNSPDKAWYPGAFPLHFLQDF